MISTSKFKKILNSGIDVTHYFILNYIDNNIDFKELCKNVKVLGNLTLLVSKGYLIKIKDGYSITQLGKNLLTTLEEENKEDVVIKNFDFTEYCKNLLESLKSVIKSKIQKTNVKLYGNHYFLPGLTEFSQRLSDFCKKYKFSDYEKMEKVLKKYTKECFPLGDKKPKTLKYYILEQNSKGSQLLSDIENFEEEDKNKDYEGTNI